MFYAIKSNSEFHVHFVVIVLELVKDTFEKKQ